jgi:hypothetical protein
MRCDLKNKPNKLYKPNKPSNPCYAKERLDGLAIKDR